jgi:hypothetical protein
LGIGDWGLGIGDGDWGLGPIPNPQSPIPNPQSPIPINLFSILKNLLFFKLYHLDITVLLIKYLK